MTDFRQYLASPATAERPSAGELDALAARYEWFAPVRIAREIVTGRCDPRLAVTAPWREQSSLLRRPIDAEAVLRLLIRELLRRENRAAPQKGTFEKTNRAPHRLRGKGTTHTL